MAKNVNAQLVTSIILCNVPYIAGRGRNDYTFSSLLVGTTFYVIRTDHASLVWLKNYKDPDDMLVRWLAKLKEYKFDTIHRPGPW